MPIARHFDPNNLADVLDRLEEIEEQSDGSFKALCPAHNDTNPSFHVTPKDGRLLRHCFAGCSDDEVIDALVNRSPAVDVQTNGRIYLDDAQYTASYRYRGDDGKVYVKRRRGRGQGKSIDWETPGPAGVPLGLFHEEHLADAIAKQEPIHLPEGEEDVLAIERAGGVATTSGGTGSWQPHHPEFLRDAHVRIIRDRDDAGAKHALKVKRSLIGVVASVGVYEALTGKDASDHLNAGHSLDELVPADRFTRRQLADVIEGGIEPPAFLIEGVLYEGKAHALLGEPGEGKTLVVLHFAAELIRAGKAVAWFDEENGPEAVASRLVALGVEIDDVREHFRYFPFTEPTLDDADELVAEVCSFGAVLVVFDSGADMYVAAGLDENSNTDMTAWAHAFSQRLARQEGIASVVLEHVTKKGDSLYQRGASAKKAKVDASWKLKVRLPFDAETIGEVDLQRAKDRLAHLPSVVRYRIGGDGAGNTVCERVEVGVEAERIAEFDKAKLEAFKDEAIRVLRENGATSHDTGLTQTTLTGLLSPAAQTFKNKAVQYAASDPRTPVRSGAKGRTSIVYWVEGDA